ncbi:Glycosyltransferase involved in cell wall bisynthesis [Micromonospora phaseoli]|uniref:Glycosyltransferase involved in cell wall bisynthesis n=1 Tax=Micromonospora phaseoli TaxID=1144548 RepID=A0A1H6SPR0_9ACTN|nr:glycosyltransferase [Micromonospora phaseoli]PZW03909.1 glycosyltransferase involved in cell wall biosynthesis [Micromonospora phaseoli]GIJ77676.1 hypothetical protein Xph01_21080 [Micromonospora phaseoli]SEI65845.1 Glycosyltransferase involved in cell wall bisynthesis [Micromonospora phaseoli]
MSSRDTIVFWQNVPSIHQAPLMRTLAQHAPGPVVVITEFDLPPQREKSGWHRPDYGPATLIAAPSVAERERLEASLAGGVHIFSGVGAYRATTGSLLSIRSRGGALVGVYTEPWNPVSWRGWLRSLRTRMAARRLLGDVDFLLTTGPVGERQYVRIGFPATRVFRFGYFVDPHERVDADVTGSTEGGPIRLVFVGSVDRRKQPELLLTALSRCERDWTLDVVGNGPLLHRAMTLANRLGIDSRVHWQGHLSNTAARDVIAAGDILVLPSRHDGWGAVVNEALMAGTRVVVSDRCGAQDLAVSDSLSRLFDGTDVTSLTRALSATMSYGRVGADERAARVRWAAAHLAPERGAKYLLDLVAHVRDGSPRPAPPWNSTGAGAEKTAQ